MTRARTQEKLVARRPFVFRGAMLAQDEEFTPDDPAQSALLVTIGYAAPAAPKRRSYRHRAIPAAESAAVVDSVEERADG